MTDGLSLCECLPKLVKALQDELRPLVNEARRLADNKNLASAEVFRSVDNVRIWLDAALAMDDLP